MNKIIGLLLWALTASTAFIFGYIFEPTKIVAQLMGMIIGCIALLPLMYFWFKE